MPPSQPQEPVIFGMAGHSDLRAMCEDLVGRATDMSWLSRGDSIFIKVACNSPNEHPAVTSPGAIRAMVGFLRDRGAGTIYVGDQSGVEHVRLTATKRVASTREMMAQNGLYQAVRDSGAVLHNFDDFGWDGYERSRLDFENHWRKSLWLPKILQRVDHVVNLPRLGTHALAGYTCGVKNGVGWLRDDSRLLLHQRGRSFFEKMAEINHALPLREKTRLVVTLATHALLNIGPDFGDTYPFDGTLGIASTDILQHDYLASALIPWLDRHSGSVFDLYVPYPIHVNYWNRRLVDDTWGERALEGYEPIVPYRLERHLAYDMCLSHLARLQGRRPDSSTVVVRGDAVPAELRSHLRSFGGGFFVLV